MLKRLMSVAVGAVAVTGAATAEDQPYELLSATVDGRLLFAIVDHQGAAIAVDLREERPEIIRGVAAGAILSDLREVTDPGSEVTIDGVPLQTVAQSGLTHSQVRVDGAVRVGRASRAETEAVIDGLPNLTPKQRQQLKSLLAL